MVDNRQDITEEQINQVIQQYNPSYQRVLQKFGLQDFQLKEYAEKVLKSSGITLGTGLTLGAGGFALGESFAEGITIGGFTGGPLGAIIGGGIGLIVGGAISIYCWQNITQKYDDKRQKQYEEIYQWALKKLNITKTSKPQYIRERHKNLMSTNHPDKYKYANEQELQDIRNEFFEIQIAFQFITDHKKLNNTWDE